MIKEAALDSDDINKGKLVAKDNQSVELDNQLPSANNQLNYTDHSAHNSIIVVKFEID